MASKAIPVFRIVPTTQMYDWGKIGLSSKVAQFATASELPNFVLDESLPYAELWMGTHSKSPSHVWPSNQMLAEYLAAHPSLIGDAVAQRFDTTDGNLPFLLKVLSIEKALSVQAHPDKQLAEHLHNEHPDVYKDPNHKPELALALTPFSALCGFLPLQQIAVYMSFTPEFSSLIPESVREQFLSISSSSTPDGSAAKEALKGIFSAVMMTDESKVKDLLVKLITRYRTGAAVDEERSISELVLRLDSQFPGDIGIFCSYMLNYIQLQPGEAIFLGAGEPHAYVSGDIIECMANSDNVIRAGLTSKLRDIPNLVSSLTYSASPPLKHFVYPSTLGDSDVLIYDPPIPEFSIFQMRIPDGETRSFAPVNGPSIVIVVQGQGKVQWEGQESALLVSEGCTFFIGARTPITISAEDLHTCVMYRAFTA